MREVFAINCVTHDGVMQSPDRDDVRLGYGRRFDVFGERNDRVPGPVAQEIEARVVGDAKQPALEIIHPGPLGSPREEP